MRLMTCGPLMPCCHDDGSPATSELLFCLRVLVDELGISDGVVLEVLWGQLVKSGRSVDHVCIPMIHCLDG